MSKLRVILGVALVLALAAFAASEWQRSARLSRELISMREKCDEAESALRSISLVKEAETQELRELRDQTLALSNRAERLEAELAAAKRSRAPDAPHESANPAQAMPEESAEPLTVAVLQGDLAALDTLADLTRKAVSANRPGMTSDEQERLSAQLRPIWAAFDTLADAASRGDENALQALVKSARMPDLSGLAMKSLGKLAGQGLEGALNVVLDPTKYGIEVPFASTVAALKPAAENGSPRAIEALAAVASNDSQQPLWYMAADALGRSAESGNPTAIEALISFSRSTNQSTLRAVRAGLGAAAANQNERAIQALRNMSSQQTATGP